MENKSQKNTVNTLYLMLVFSTILGFVPNFMAFLLSLALWLTVLMAAYFYRSKDKEDGLLYNHMTYLIGTVWIGTSFILLGTMIGAYWIFSQGDVAPFYALMSQVENGVMIGEAEVMDAFNVFIAGNKNLVMTASLVTVGPAILYFVYRVANGYSRACKGYRIANPKSWL